MLGVKELDMVDIDTISYVDLMHKIDAANEWQARASAKGCKLAYNEASKLCEVLNAERLRRIALPPATRAE